MARTSGAGIAGACTGACQSQFDHKRIQTRCRARDQARCERTDDAAALVAQQRYRDDGRGNRSHESCDDEEGAHSSSGMRERWRTTR